jgi:hypothetical protein
MLTGQELLSFVEANADMDQYEIARGAGYSRVTEKGAERVLINKLSKALLEAKGVKLKSGNKPGKVAQYMTTVHRTGVVLVGKTYTEQFGINPGDELKIVVDEDCIRLVPKLNTSTPSPCATGACPVGV